MKTKETLVQFNIFEMTVFVWLSVFMPSITSGEVNRRLGFWFLRKMRIKLTTHRINTNILLLFESPKKWKLACSPSSLFYLFECQNIILYSKEIKYNILGFNVWYFYFLRVNKTSTCIFLIKIINFIFPTGEINLSIWLCVKEARQGQPHKREVDKKIVIRNN